MNKYFLTETTGGLIQGHDFAPSNVAEAYFDATKKVETEAEFVNLTQLNVSLSNTQGENAEIILCKYNGQQKEKLAKKFPKATFRQYDNF